MAQTFNIYCDESCHLENDHHKSMVLGALWCPENKIKEASERIKEIKTKHGIKPTQEIKWVKVTPSKVNFYIDLVDYFFDNENLHFRALIIPEKKLLNHSKFEQTHNTWYYKMYYNLLKVILNPNDAYRIYIDIKDTKGAEKIAELRRILQYKVEDFSEKIVERMQLIRSHEVQLIQLADLLIGAVSYTNREITSSNAKLSIIERIKKRSGYTLTRNTLFREDKVNIFQWVANEGAR